MRLNLGDVIKSIHTGNAFVVEYVSADGHCFILQPRGKENSRSYNMHDFNRSFVRVSESDTLQAGNSPVIGIDPASGHDHTVEEAPLSQPHYQAGQVNRLVESLESRIRSLEIGECKGTLSALEMDTLIADRQAVDTLLKPAWVVPDEMPWRAMRSVQIDSKLGTFASAHLSGAYDMFAEFWKVAIAASGRLIEGPRVLPRVWIPVSVLLPEVEKGWLDTTVIIALRGEKEGSEALYCTDGKFRWGRDEEPIDDEITHWMPRPSAPQEVKGE